VTPTPDAGIALLVRDDADIPEPSDDAPLTEGDDEARSLLEDVEALIDDGKTYLEAELAFQRTRAAFVADRTKSALMFGVAAALLAFLALIGLSVGSIIALAPVLTAWGASALVVGILLAAATLAALAASRSWKSLMGSLSRSGNDADQAP
jgi:uncharacterized membrane protein YqjE